MLGPIRNALLAALIAALGTIGVSYAAIGSVNPVNVVSHKSVTPAAEPSNHETGSSEVTPTARQTPEPSESPNAEHNNKGKPQANHSDEGQAQAREKDEGRVGHEDQPQANQLQANHEDQGQANNEHQDESKAAPAHTSGSDGHGQSNGHGGD